MLENCDVIAIFSIYGQFEAIRNPDACIFSLIVTFYLAKAGNKTKNL